jgi:chloride channel 7
LNQISTAFAVYFLINMAYALVATLTVCFFGHAAAASGIPEVKGYLNGVWVRHTINLKTFVGKLISILFSYSSCLALGPEGPMVHLGAIIGGGLIMGKSAVLNIRLPKMFEQLRNDRDQRDFIASGASAGITAAFGAPVGGVLFGLEEAASHWRREMTWRTFFGCMLAAFTVNLFSSFAADKADQTSAQNVKDYGLLKFGVSSREFTYRYAELLPFTIIGVIGGVLGALFTALSVRISVWRRDNIRGRKLYGAIEVMIVTAFSAMLTFGIPALVSCRPVAEVTYLPDICEADNHRNTTDPVTLFCEAEDGKSFNDMVNLMMLPAEDALRRLFSRTHNYYTLQALAVYLVVYFSMVTITAGLFVAGGLFVPMMLVGATFGRMVGQVVALMFPSETVPIDVSVYALVGATAMMAGFSRITISLCVIMMELTETTQYLLPIMLAVQAAKWVGDGLGLSLYDALMEVKSIPFLEHHTPPHTWLAGVSRFMTSKVVCVREVERVDRIVELLQFTKHSGFPVVSIRHGHHRIFKGFISRNQLALLVDKEQYEPADEDVASELGAGNHTAAIGSSFVQKRDSGTFSSSPIGFFSRRSASHQRESGDERGNSSATGGGLFSDGSESEAYVGDQTFTQLKFRRHMLNFDHYRWLLNNWGWSGAVEDLRMPTVALQRRTFLDLRPYMDRSHIIVQSSFSFSHAYKLFQTAEQRALPVIDSHHRVVGILTRHDFLKWHFEDTHDNEYDDDGQRFDGAE